MYGRDGENRRRPGSGDAAERGLPDFAQVLAAFEPGWAMCEDNYEPAIEHELESRFFVGNGFLGIRGSLDVPAGSSLPRTYVAGLFDLRPGPPPTSALVPAPDAFALRLLVDGEEFAIDARRLLRHTRLLDYRNGALHSLLQQEIGRQQKLTLDSLRFASLATRNLALQLIRLQLERPAEVRVEFPEPPDSPHARPAGPDAWRTRDGSMALVWAKDSLAEGSRGWRRLPAAGGLVRGTRGFSLLQLTAYGLAESVAKARTEATEAVTRARKAGPQRLYRGHSRAWRHRWQESDVGVDGDEAAQEALRFAVYQLNSAVNSEMDGASVGARGLTGDAYIGHVFWDTEVFMLPFYIYTFPEAARALLEYRHRTLPAAREKARQLGFRGALYAWESTDTGREVTPPYAIGPRGEVIAIRNGDLEHHISSAVAYGVWRYWQATRDVTFLLGAGAEILLETARFWASRGLRERDGSYHIRHVIGPDEYHEDVDDNAYTNAMARWNIERALEVARLLSSRWPKIWTELAKDLELGEGELEEWRSVARDMHVGRDPATGVPEQFAGFFGLEHIDLASFKDRTAPVDVLLGPERTRRSQVIKQADVLMLIALLPNLFPERVQQAAFDYYEPRTGHGSSLSPPMHALVAARLGRRETAEAFFRQTAAIDLNDSMGNSAGGIHMAALGGLWQAAVFGFGGMSAAPGGLSFRPRLPEGWRELRFRVHWRGRRLAVEVSRTSGRMQLRLDKGRPLGVQVYGERYRLEQAKPVVVPLGRGKAEEGR